MPLKADVFQQLDLPLTKKIILFTAKYIPKKRPMDLLRAVRLLNRKDIMLVMVGEGILRKEMEEYVRKEKMDNVRFVGFVNQSLISLYYVSADLFVMCSGMGETWGLSVNEAMNFALPVVITETCGCSNDLIDEGENGFIVEEANTTQLAAAIEKGIASGFKDNAGIKSLARIHQYSITEITGNLKKAAIV